jgi:hypothetical protein
MCTLLILLRPGDPWPVILAGNRDEMEQRPWRAPGRHWPDLPEVTAGLDLLAGGSWMGINDHGLAAVVMNRSGTLGPAPGHRSRGTLVLRALEHVGAAQAWDALRHLEPSAFRPFNLIVADALQALWIRNDGTALVARTIPPGLHMLTARELNDGTDPRIRAYLPRFRAARIPNPDSGDWDPWSTLLGSRDTPLVPDPRSAMCFRTDTGFSTQCASLLALPASPERDTLPIWLFAEGAPDQVPFLPLNTLDNWGDADAETPNPH